MALESLVNGTKEMLNDLLLQLEKRLAPLPHQTTSRMHPACLKHAQVSSESCRDWDGLKPRGGRYVDESP